MEKIIIIEQSAYEMMKKHFDVFIKEIELLCGESSINKNWLDNQDVCMLLHKHRRRIAKLLFNHRSKIKKSQRKI